MARRLLAGAGPTTLLLRSAKLCALLPGAVTSLSRPAALATTQQEEAASDGGEHAPGQATSPQQLLGAAAGLEGEGAGGPSGNILRVGAGLQWLRLWCPLLFF